ncbi:MAG: PfkB family carbohydrate kinase [Chloroflexota bacterium]
MIAARPDLLVIGGLTIDRFADGSTAPGGSVLHIARAVTARGLRVAVATVAGPEPEARSAVEELRQLAVALEAADADATATFSHHDTAQGRRLRLERRGGRVDVPGSALVAPADAILVAPVAGEVATEDLALLASVPVRAAILQGWLRSLEEGADVGPLPIAALGAAAVDDLGRFDLLVASREDLLAESRDPREQLSALRHAVGTKPALIVTDGADGLWLDADGSVRHLPVPQRVDSVSTVGAGDILAAFLAMGGGDPTVTMERRAGDAMRIVAEVLEERRG